MPRKRHPIDPQRGWAGTAARITLVIGILALGVEATRLSLAQTFRQGSPQIAASFAPNDAGIMAIRAERLLSGLEGVAAEPAAAEALAKSALLRDATNASAAGTLGFLAAGRNDAALAQRLFLYGQSLSRRDLRVQLWAIEDAVARQSIPEALQHYDIALRTSRTAPELLFPVLGAAISDPVVRAETAKILRGRPAWGPTFVRQVASHGPDFGAAADLFATLRRDRFPFPEGADASLIAGLIAQNAFERGWNEYTARHPGASRVALRDPHFNATMSIPSAFDWNLASSEGISTAIQAGAGGNVFTFDVSAGQSGLLLRQLQVLPPGRYRLRGKSRGSFAPAPSWTLTCLSGSVLGTVRIAGGEAASSFQGEITVPVSCPVQWLSLSSYDADVPAAQSGEVEIVSIEPLA